MKIKLMDWFLYDSRFRHDRVKCPSKDEKYGFCTNLFAQILNNYQGKFLKFYNFRAVQS